MIYNLGNGHGFTVREVVESARRVTGQPIPVEESAPPARRSCGFDCQLGKNRNRTRLEAEVHQARRHRAQRLGVASAALPGDSNIS